MRRNQSERQRKYLLSPDLKTIIYQPNKVTKAIYDYSLIQEKVFNTIMFYLQDAIQGRMKGNDYTQLSLFKVDGDNYIKLNIPLKVITKYPQQYPNIIKSLIQLSTIPVTFPFYDEKRKENRIAFSGLITGDFPEKSSYKSTITIIMRREIAKLLIDIDIDNYRRPINYTKYVFEIAQSAKNKYTPRIYKLISSWKVKGQFTISLEEFRKWLGVEQKYKFYRDIKVNILLPVQKELIKKADCWFNCDEDDFLVKNGRIVTHFNFKVFSNDFNEKEEKLRDYAKYLLIDHYNFAEEDFLKINSIFQSSNNIASILEKIAYVQDVIRNSKPPITNVKNYIQTALLNEFT
jgi:Initiator Replication protein